jgi:hypothetical protein
MDEASAFVAINPEELGPECPPLMAGAACGLRRTSITLALFSPIQKKISRSTTAFERHARALSSDAAAGRDHMGLTPRYFPLHAHIASMTVISSFPALLNL